jgi:cytidylate kinase
VRDRADQTRATAPLCAAPDAMVIDTSHMAIDAVVEAIVAEIQKHPLFREFVSLEGSLEP